MSLYLLGPQLITNIVESEPFQAVRQYGAGHGEYGLYYLDYDYPRPPDTTQLYVKQEHGWEPIFDIYQFWDYLYFGWRTNVFRDGVVRLEIRYMQTVGGGPLGPYIVGTSPEGGVLIKLKLFWFN